MSLSSFFFFNDTATTEIYTLSLHDALPISGSGGTGTRAPRFHCHQARRGSIVTQGASISARRSLASAAGSSTRDRKSTRLNSSHLVISYAVFCLKKKKKKEYQPDS